MLQFYRDGLGFPTCDIVAHERKTTRVCPVLQPEHDRGDGAFGVVTGGSFGVPGGQVAELFAPPRGRWSTGLTADAVADVCGRRRVDHPHDLQLNARRQHLEQPAASTEQHRDLMDLHLVQLEDSPATSMM